MFKMSTGVVALLFAGWFGGACSGQSGLQAVGGTVATAGQAAGSTSSSTAGAGGTGGVAGGTMAGGAGGAAAGTGGTGVCPLDPCRVLVACGDGTEPKIDSCGCSVCPPTADAGVANDAGHADAPPSGSACPMLENLNSMNAAQVNWGAARFWLQCSLTGGVTEDCLSDDAIACSEPDQAAGKVLGCTSRCAADEYGLFYGGVGPMAAPPSIALPAGCRIDLTGPGGPVSYCCPCTLASDKDAAIAEVGAGADTGSDTGLCPSSLAHTGDACPKLNLQCPGVATDPYCFGWHCTCAADGTWTCSPSSCE